MTLRENFEKLFPVPEGVKWWHDSRNCYIIVDANNIALVDLLLVHNARWQGFQSGHAAGLERAAVIAEETIAHETEFGRWWCSPAADAIRAMKEQA